MTAARSWYEFKALSEKEAELCIYDEIGGWGITASAFVADLKKHTGKSLVVRINSPGGAVTEGSAIFNALRRHKGGVITQIDGLAASMGSYIAMAGTPIRMAENAYLMIHNASGLAYGDATDLRGMADVVEKMTNTLAEAYAAKSGKDAEEIREAMAAETWFTAKEAKAYGLVDEVTDSVKAAASFDLTKFRNAPRVDTPKQAAPMATFSQDQFDAEVNAKTEAQAQAQKNFKDFTAATAERDSLKAKLEESDAERAILAKGMEDAKAKIELHAKELTAAKVVTVEAVNARAIEVLSAAGHPPINQRGGSSDGANEMTRTEWEKLAPKARAEFVTKGGKLTD